MPAGRPSSVWMNFNNGLHLFTWFNAFVHFFLTSIFWRHENSHMRAASHVRVVIWTALGTKEGVAHHQDGAWRSNPRQLQRFPAGTWSTTRLHERDTQSCDVPSGTADVDVWSDDHGNPDLPVSHKLLGYILQRSMLYVKKMYARRLFGTTAVDSVLQAIVDLWVADSPTFEDALSDRCPSVDALALPVWCNQIIPSV